MLSLTDVQSYFTVPLRDMSDTEAAFDGILIPECDIHRPRIGITDQFLAGAEAYSQAYMQTAYFSALIKAALAGMDLEGRPLSILDIGSGSGNSVFPCLELLPQASVVATDLSPNLLAIMRRYAEGNPDWHGRLSYVCMDACDDYYRPGSFDLVIGAAILHHLIDPSRALHAASRALKPSGVAVFFEPFENGNAVLRLAYEDILRRTGPHPLPKEVAELLAAMVNDVRVRAGADKSAEIYRQIDDKWLFTRTYIERTAREAGFRELRIKPILRTENQFRRQTEVNLKLGRNLPPDALPAWAWDIIARYDDAFSAELKQDLLIEGSIVLVR